jgi:hypothetical protein
MDRTDRKDPDAPQARYNGLSWIDFNTLATYNGECARGISHTPAWDATMASLQRRFDEGEAARAGTRVDFPGTA